MGAGGRGRPRASIGLRLAGGVRARRDRVAHRRGGARGDPAPPQRSAAAADGHRGREPDQRRHGARALQGGGRGGVPARSRCADAGLRVRRPTAWAALRSGSPRARLDHASCARRVDDPPTEITISLLSGYAAYLPAEELGALGRDRRGHGRDLRRLAHARLHRPRRCACRASRSGRSSTFLLNAVLFLLVGLQLPTVLDRHQRASAGELIGWGAARQRGR